MVMGVATILAFQAVWIVCALGAAAGTNWPGVLAAAALAAWHLATAADRVRLAALLAISGVVGAIAESALSVSGFVTFGAGTAHGIAPAWIVALWVAFSTTLLTLATWLAPAARVKAAALGLVAGPLAYIAGERLGALTLAPDAWWAAIGAIAAVWTVATPLLLTIMAWLRPHAGSDAIR